MADLAPEQRAREQIDALLAERAQIVAEVDRRLSVVEELESEVSANLQRATRLRQSILQKAFGGKPTLIRGLKHATSKP